MLLWKIKKRLKSTVINLLLRCQKHYFVNLAAVCEDGKTDRDGSKHHRLPEPDTTSLQGTGTVQRLHDDQR